MAGFLNGQLQLDSYGVTTSSGDNNDVSTQGSLIYITVSNNNDAITGIVAPTGGAWVLVVNIGPTNSLVIKNNSASSVAANRILTANGSDLTVLAYETVALGYDTTNAQWHVVKFKA